MKVVLECNDYKQCHFFLNWNLKHENKKALQARCCKDFLYTKYIFRQINTLPR